MELVEDPTDDDREITATLKSYLNGKQKGTRRNTLMASLASRSETADGNVVVNVVLYTYNTYIGF